MNPKPLILFFLFQIGISCSVQKDTALNDNALISKGKIDSLISKGMVFYSDFGAAGDGTRDDMLAIAATHDFANKHDLEVKADDGAKYYIGANEQTAVIQTDTDFGNASFIIDDSKVGVEERNNPIFLVSSKLKPFKPTGINTLKRNQKKIVGFLNNERLKSLIKKNKLDLKKDSDLKKLFKEYDSAN